MRRFLYKFHTEFPLIPMYGLFDPNPSGVDIFRIYKYGSSQSCLENFFLPTFQLLGVDIDDMKELGLIDRPDVGVILTRRDHLKLTRLMNSEEGKKDRQIREACQRMQAIGKKCEIEALSKLGEYYVTEAYIPMKMQQLHNERHLQSTSLDDSYHDIPIASTSTETNLMPFKHSLSSQDSIKSNSFPMDEQLLVRSTAMSLPLMQQHNEIVNDSQPVPLDQSTLSTPSDGNDEWDGIF